MAPNGKKNMGYLTVDTEITMLVDIPCQNFSRDFPNLPRNNIRIDMSTPEFLCGSRKVKGDMKQQHLRFEKLMLSHTNAVSDSKTT